MTHNNLPPPALSFTEALDSSAMRGCILGQAMGDSLGLPFEGQSRRSVHRCIDLPLQQAMFFGWGFVSDDTEHALLTLEALRTSGPDMAQFERALAGGLKRWVLTASPGVGGATLKAALKLCLGVSPSRSGVHSAGNGPAMRAAVLGVAFKGDWPLLAQAVRVSSRLTHTDERAVDAAMVVAFAAALSVGSTRDNRLVMLDELEEHVLPWLAGPEPFQVLFESMRCALVEELTTPEFATRMGCGKGVSGYAMHSVPVALYAWLRNPLDVQHAVLVCVTCGGDTDSTAAIAGALAGARVGPQAMPTEWTSRLATIQWAAREALGHKRSAARRFLALPVNLALLMLYVGVYFRRAVKGRVRIQRGPCL